MQTPKNVVLKLHKVWDSSKKQLISYILRFNYVHLLHSLWYTLSNIVEQPSFDELAIELLEVAHEWSSISECQYSIIPTQNILS